MSDRRITPTTDMERNQTADQNSGSLDALVRRVRDANGTTDMEYPKFTRDVDALCLEAENMRRLLDSFPGFCAPTEIGDTWIEKVRGESPND